MAGGLNSAFLLGPDVFLTNNFIYAPDNGLVHGIGNFGLTEVSVRPTRSCRIGPFTSTSWRAHPINAFYLLGHPNNNNSHALPNTVNYMLTMHLSGCQFLAYGPNRHNVTVEHNNYIGGGGGTYVGRAAAVGAHPFMFQLRPGLDYNPMELANVVGVRGAGGWQFYVRRQAFVSPGPVTGPH